MTDQSEFEEVERERARIKTEYAKEIDKLAREMLDRDARGELDDWVDEEPHLAAIEQQYGYDIMSAVVDRMREVNPDTQV